MPRLVIASRLPIYILIFLALLAGACSPAQAVELPGITPEGGVAVDPLFREFYDLLGGREVLGPAISPAFDFANRQFQYTDKVCLEYDPEKPAGERFRLAALGLDLGLNEPSMPAPQAQDPLYINGHFVYSSFHAFANQMGYLYTGSPLSEVHYNAEKRRYEQYFENIGLYWNEADPPEAVKLLSYGAWKCDIHCRFTPLQESLVDIELVAPSPSDEIFRQGVIRLGSDLTGFPLSGPYTAADGRVEKIYENAVLAYDPANPSSLSLRPISEKVGILAQPAVGPSGMQGMFFWETDAARGLGYNVPQPFMDYLSSHGGAEAFGQPLGELTMNQNEVFQQCFANLCLEYHLRTNVPTALRIRPAPLGYVYREIHSRGQENRLDPATLESLTLQVWEKYQYISNIESQEIGAAVFDSGQPVEGVTPLLVVTFPDGSQGSFYFPPTGSNGITTLRLEPIISEKGTIIPYQVCVNMLSEDLFCVKDSFVIWYNP
jgi:hypothetical protein